ncbi:hypothetical protein Leryth_011532 [Lithospermum erythrorhizon]|nr:hypothetical protein Leryth_011532 [Lithospermum erythrorhizon]
MSFFPIFRGALLSFLAVLAVIATTQCHADEQMIEVVGIGECADCKEQKIQTNHAFSGLQVTIDCKNQLGTIERWGVGQLNEEGKFKVSLPKEILKDGNLKHDCYAQLHSAASAPCPAKSGLESIKVVAKTDTDGKHITFEPAQKLTFSTDLCTSATFWPPHKPLPKLPKIGFKKHHFGHKYKFPPLHKKPLPVPPMFPTPVPKTPEPPVTKPEPPVTFPKKPEPPSIPKKPCPPKPKKKSKPEKPKKEEPKKKKPEKPKKEEPKKMPPVVKPPVEKPPIVTPPIINPPTETPPIKKLPCPPLFKKFPPKDFHHPKLPPFPTIPPKYFHHPKLPHFPLPPHIPHA